jgi:hypothetical protein
METNKFEKVLRENKCACWFENNKLKEECHYHACVRTGTTGNGDPISWISNFKDVRASRIKKRDELKSLKRWIDNSGYKPCFKTALVLEIEKRIKKAGKDE